jgi:hypothetical protein
MKVILEEYLMAIDAAAERIARCEQAMRDLLPGCASSRQSKRSWPAKAFRSSLR